MKVGGKLLAPLSSKAVQVAAETWRKVRGHQYRRLSEYLKRTYDLSDEDVKDTILDMAMVADNSSTKRLLDEYETALRATGASAPSFKARREAAEAGIYLRPPRSTLKEEDIAKAVDMQAGAIARTNRDLVAAGVLSALQRSPEGQQLIADAAARMDIRADAILDQIGKRAEMIRSLSLSDDEMNSLLSSIRQFKRDVKAEYKAVVNRANTVLPHFQTSLHQVADRLKRMELDGLSQLPTEELRQTLAPIYGRVFSLLKSMAERQGTDEAMGVASDVIELRQEINAALRSRTLQSFRPARELLSAVKEDIDAALRTAVDTAPNQRVAREWLEQFERATERYRDVMQAMATKMGKQLENPAKDIDKAARIVADFMASSASGSDD